MTVEPFAFPETEKVNPMSTDVAWLENRLNGAGAPVIIDGGMGTELQRSGAPMDSKVWSGRAVLTHPDAVRQAHEAFITAGAEVIITNTFAAARHVLEPGGLGDHVGDINRQAVRLARQARDNVAEEPVAIAGSICEWAPPDDPRWNTPEAVGRSAREQAGILAEAGVDLIALEMCERIDFSLAVVDATLEFGLPVWVGLSARTHKNCSSLSVFDYQELDFTSLVEATAGYPSMLMNVMHTPVPDVDEAIGIVKRHWDGAIGVYPESGYFTVPNWQFVDVIEPEALALVARNWVERGVRLVGGCCGLGPEHIAALRQALR